MDVSLFERLNQLNHWQIDLTIVLLLLQGAVFTIFPEETIIITVGILWQQKKLEFLEAVLAIQLGLLPANVLLAFFGNRFGSKALALRPFSWIIQPKLVEKSLLKLRKFGIITIFVTRFVPLVRGPMYFAAGMSGMSLFHFFIADALASWIQIPLLLLLGSKLF